MPQAAVAAVDMAQVGHGVRRRRLAVAAAAALLLVALNGCTGSTTSSDAEKPSASGSVATVDHLGVDAKLSAAVDAAMSDKDGRHGNVRAVLVIHHGRTLVANYYHSRASDHHNVYSVTKSVLSTLVGIAVLDRLLSLDQTVGELLPDSRSSMTRQVAGITVRQLLTMTAGLPPDPFGGNPGFTSSPNWVDFIVSYGVDHKPGTSFGYSSAGAHLLAAILTRVTGQPLLIYARTHLFDPLGIDTRPAFTPTATSGTSLLDLPRYTSAKTGFAWPRDPQGIDLGFSGLKLTPTDLAALGQLYLHRGRWNNQQIIPAAWTRTATSPHVAVGQGVGYGYLWWTNTRNGHRFFAALGAEGQTIGVIPDLDVVIVAVSDLDGLTANPVSADELGNEILKVVLPAVDG